MSELNRANKVAVSVTEDGIMVAKFHRTHKLVAEVKSTDVDVAFPVGINKTAIRELFRAFVVQHADQYGVLWQPEVLSTNTVPAKYTDDELLMDTACKLIQSDIVSWVTAMNEDLAKVGKGIRLESIQADMIDEMTTNKGKPVQPKYNNGNWAWATVPMTITIVDEATETQGYVTMTCKLVSGQLKKPDSIGDGNYNYTNFKSEVAKDLGELVAIPKKEESKVEELPAVAEVQEEVTPDKADTMEEPKPKAKRKSKKAKSE